MGRATLSLEKLRVGWIAALIVGLAMGAAIWALSPHIAGSVEPWDSDSPFYFGSLFAVGVFSWIIFRRKTYVVVMGLYLGQLVYLLAVGFGPLSLVGVVLLVPYSLVAGIGALIAYVFAGHSVR